jgi:hypothetical protein
MDTHDGFVSGIYNYCDRWCERCEFTRWCRIFADRAEFEARLDPGLKALVDAPPLPEEIPPPPPRAVQELIEEMNAAAAEVSAEDMKPVHPEFDPDDHPPGARAMSYSTAAHLWLRRHESARPADLDDPLNVISWDSTSIPAKIHRALHGLAWLEPDELDDVRDHEGSAKVALVGLERSHAAWLELVRRGVLSQTGADEFIADLVWLTDEVDRLFPGARAFVRPVFDEPDAAARLREERQ